VYETNKIFFPSRCFTFEGPSYIRVVLHSGQYLPYQEILQQKAVDFIEVCDLSFVPIICTINFGEN